MGEKLREFFKDELAEAERVGMEKGRKEGKEEGIAIGEKRGEILGAVKAYGREGVSPHEIMRRIMKDYDVSRKDALIYVSRVVGFRRGLFPGRT